MDLTKLSLRELENLRALQLKILELSAVAEQELLQHGGKKRLQEMRDDALDKLLAIQKEIKKRQP